MNRNNQDPLLNCKDRSVKTYFYMKNPRTPQKTSLTQNAIIRIAISLSIGVSLGTSPALASLDLRSEQDSAFTPSLNPQPTKVLQTSTVAEGTRLNAANPFSEEASLFRPPSNPRPSGTRTTIGTRTGGCLGNPSQFATFGPDSAIGQTTLARPTFTWYLPSANSEVQVVFRLLAPNEEGIPSTVHRIELPYVAGYNTYNLPLEVPGLTSGPEYRWQIAVNCEPNNPSRAIVEERSIERVDTSTALTQALAAATTSEEKALAYGNQGLWYDAIAQVAQAQTDRAIAIRTGLLRDLANSEANASQPIAD